ncbi:MAG TPA: glycosyltransferase [Microlunatus sp.]|nr:glycosyltransferase [Microlunatus sp.]
MEQRTSAAAGQGGLRLEALALKILFPTAAGLGHIHPLIPFAKAASAVGDEVLFAVPAAGMPTVGGFGFDAISVPSGDPSAVGQAWARLPATGVNGYVVAEIFTRIQGRAALPAYRSAIADFRPDLVISTEVAGHVAAEASGVASAFLGITALDLADLDWSAVAAATNDLRADAGLAPTSRPPYESGMAYLSAVPPLLWADPTMLPVDWIWYRHEDAEGRAHLASRPSRSRPQIYATLGSVAGGNDFGRPLFDVLLQTLGEIDADVLFTVGTFDQSRLRPAPPNVRVAAYEPQSRAMICDAAVIHGGAGTTVAALARGIPLVTVPMFADQMHNADRLVAHGLGLRVEPDQVAHALVPAVRQILNDPTYRTNAQAAAAAIAARPTPAEALDLLRRGI